MGSELFSAASFRHARTGRLLRAYTCGVSLCRLTRMSVKTLMQGHGDCKGAGINTEHQATSLFTHYSFVCNSSSGPKHNAINDKERAAVRRNLS